MPGRAGRRKATCQTVAGEGTGVSPHVIFIMPFLHYPSNLLHPDAASKPLLSKFWNVPERLVEMKLLQLNFVNLVEKLGW